MAEANDISILDLAIKAMAMLISLGGLILAIRGIIGPKLRLSLFDSKGELTRYGEGPDAPPVYFYHLRVGNKRRWIASNVSIKLIEINKPSPDGAFHNGEIPSPVKLRWARSKTDPCSLDIRGRDAEFCNFGFLIKDRMFQLDPCIAPWPPNFRGFINAKEHMRVKVVAVADNAKSNTLCIEIAWDGKWSDEPEEMQRHLVVREVSSSS